MGFGFHCLLAESLLNNYTPAVLISGMAISAGRAVISDNGGHFHPAGVDDEPHYRGHM